MNKSTQVGKSPDFINKQFIKFIWFAHNQTLNQRTFMSGLISKLFLKFEWSRGATDTHLWFSTEMLT